MTKSFYKRCGMIAAVLLGATVVSLCPVEATAAEAKVEKAIKGGLDWLAATQSGIGHWGGNTAHPTAMTALAGMALISEGSTTTQGKYAPNIRRAVEYIMANCQKNGLLGDPGKEACYTYGHGFSMLFLSQVLGEEEDEARREELYDVLCRAAIFCGQAQTEAGGWGYVSSAESNFDEGSTTVTQVQGLRGCRDAGIPVPKEILDKAVAYIRRCTTPDGGVQYSSQSGGDGHAPITAAAIACLFNAGEYDDEYVPKMLAFCKKNIDAGSTIGHEFYTHLYYSQVLYREGGDQWAGYREKQFPKILSSAQEVNVGGKPCIFWPGTEVGPIFVTSINLIVLQIEKGFIPIFQR